MANTGTLKKALYISSCIQSSVSPLSLSQITVDDVELIDDSETLNLEDYELVEIDEDARPSDDSGTNVHKTCDVHVVIQCAQMPDVIE